MNAKLPPAPADTSGQDGAVWGQSDVRDLFSRPDMVTIVFGDLNLRSVQRLTRIR